MTNVPVMMLWIVVREHERPAGYRKQTRTNTPQRFHPDGRPKKKRPTGKRFFNISKGIFAENESFANTSSCRSDTRAARRCAVNRAGADQVKTVSMND